MKVDSFKNESKESGALMTGRRALGLIELIARRRGGYSFSELSIATELSSASLSRLLKMLVAEEWIHHADHTGTYSIGSRLLQLSDDMRVHSPSIDIIQPVVRDLALKLGHSVCLAAFQGDFFTLLAKTERRESYHFIDVLTPNADWIDNGMGQFLLSFQPAQVAQRIYQLHFKKSVPAADLARFEAARHDRSMVREEGHVTRIIAAIQTDPAQRVEHLISVAAMSSARPDTAAILTEVRAAATTIENRLRSQGVTIEQGQLSQQTKMGRELT